LIERGLTSPPTQYRLYGLYQTVVTGNVAYYDTTLALVVNLVLIKVINTTQVLVMLAASATLHAIIKFFAYYRKRSLL